jgi:hypothetical protein
VYLIVFGRTAILDALLRILSTASANAVQIRPLYA